MMSNDQEHAGPGLSDANGPLWAAILASGIGAFSMGLVVLLNEAGIFTAPSLYAPSGGVTGRTTIAAALWLVAWGVLHAKWKGRRVNGSNVRTATLILIALGLVATFPPVWGIL